MTVILNEERTLNKEQLMAAYSCRLARRLFLAAALIPTIHGAAHGETILLTHNIVVQGDPDPVDVLGEYSISGATINASLITGFPDGLAAVAASGGNIFTASAASFGIYNAAGEAVNAVVPTGALGNDAIAVSDGNVYVANGSTGVVGAYTTSGATVNADLITVPQVSGAYSIAVSDGHLFVLSNQKIGEYTTSGAVIDSSLITGLPTSLAIAASGNDIFVANYSLGTISEYSTSGALVNDSLVTGLSGPIALAVYGGNLFVVNYRSGTVGEYTTAGATVNASLITGLSLNNEEGIAIVPEPATWTLLVTGMAAFIAFRNQPRITARCHRL